MATATKKKDEAYPWKAGASSGHTTNLKQSILRLSISMHKKELFLFFVALPKVAKARTYSVSVFFCIQLLLSPILLHETYKY